MSAREGAAFGSETYALTAAELAPHTHSGATSSGNAMTYRTVNGCVGTNTANNHIVGWSGCDYVDRTDSDYALSAHTHDFTTNGGDSLTGAAHPNVQPSMALTYIIKY